MPLSTLANVRLVGLACAVPTQRVDNRLSELLLPADTQRVLKAIGVEQRRLAPAAMCTSDLCFAAAERVLTDLHWDREDIGAVVFVTQSPDHVLPATAITLQARLGLPSTTLAFDVNLGCSGYVYGLAIIAGLMSAHGIGKALLLAGETPSKMTSSRDRSVALLFGDAGTATALSFDMGAPPMYFDLCSDGRGWKSIHIPAGAYRRPISHVDLEYVTVDPNVTRNGSQLVLDGAEIFNFSINEVPKTVRRALDFAKTGLEDVDYFLFHQANLMMNETIRKKLKIPVEKAPYSLRDFGNTSSATIPLTLLSNAPVAQRARGGFVQWLMCGFGVGLSWGTALVRTDRLIVSDLIEL